MKGNILCKIVISLLFFIPAVNCFGKEELKIEQDCYILNYSDFPDVFFGLFEHHYVTINVRTSDNDIQQFYLLYIVVDSTPENIPPGYSMTMDENQKMNKDPDIPPLNSFCDIYYENMTISGLINNEKKTRSISNAPVIIKYIVKN